MDIRAGVDTTEKSKFLTVPELGLRPLGRPARSHSLYRLLRVLEAVISYSVCLKVLPTNMITAELNRLIVISLGQKRLRVITVSGGA
jgi:hypothetical protein